jgi:aspartate carbamoyltransferase
MQRLGGSVIGFSDASATSTSKGESLADTIRVVSSYADIIAMRSPKEGAAYLASKYSSIPVINAGDGGHHHPTQTLTDLVTIRAMKGSWSGHTVGFCGDLKFGRTVHSLTKALTRYPNNKFIFISPKELSIPEYIINQVFIPAGIEFKQVERLEDCIEELDILYMTRVQKERFFNEQDYIRLKDSYILDKEKMKIAKDNMDKINHNAADVHRLIESEKITVKSKIRDILKGILKKGEIVFNKTFNIKEKSKIEVVTAFMAMLELNRASKVSISQEYNFGDIKLKRK